MKRIGFADYYISEWHANNYPGWIAEANQKLGTDYQLAYVWAEKEVSPVDGVTTDEWCAKMGAERCSSLAELAQKSDVLILLAPSDPDKHLGYARELLPFGKPTYIDKTFAPNLASAKEIFAVAQAHGAPFFSTSALRYAAELYLFRGAHSLTLRGGGSRFDEYIIHLVEMAVMLLSSPVVRVCVEVQDKQRHCRLELASGETAALIFDPASPYEITAIDAQGKELHAALSSAFFPALLKDILQFFETSQPPFDPAQTLAAMSLRDALLKAEQAPGLWVETEQ